MKRNLSTLALSLLVSTVLFGLACQEKLPMSVDTVWEQAGGDANKLDAVMDKARLEDLKNLYDRFEQERQSGVPNARRWAVYAERAQKIEDGHDKLREKVLDDFKNRFN